MQFFKNMNESKLKYSSLLFEYKEDNDIEYLKEFKINFNFIKRITLRKNKNIRATYSKYFIQNLLSLLSYENSLIYLNADFPNDISGCIFMELNNLKSLKELHLQKLYFDSTFTLNLVNLEKLTLINCTNLTMAEGSCLNLKYLKLFGCILNKSESLLIKFPMLEECILQDQLLHSEQIYNEIIDFSSLQKLKYLECEKADFIYLKNSILEKVILYSKNKDEFYKSNEYEIEKKLLKN